MTKAKHNPFLGAFDKLSRPPVLTLTTGLLVVVCLTIAVVHLLHLPPLEGSGGRTETGDYFAFFTGAELVSRGAGADLYDLNVQKALQRELAGADGWDGWHAYINPPGFALLLSVVAPLGFHGSFYAFDLFCIALFFLAAVQLKPYLPQLARTRWHAVTTLLSVLSLQQVLLPMVGGQNTTITLSLLTLAYCAHRGGRPVVLGLCLGLLSYKPQYLLLLLPFLALRREWVATGVAGGVVALHYLGGALVCGWDWPHRMLNAIAIFSPSERASMGHFSLPRISEMLFDPPMQTAATVAGCALVVAVIVRALRRREGAPPALSPTWALLLCGSLLVSPHLNYYDAGVMVLPILLLVDHRMGTESRPLARGERLWLLFLWGVYPAWELAEHLHVQPLFFVLVAVFVWAERALRWGGPVPAARPIAAPSPAPATDPG